MKKADWKGIAELVGISAIVASLIFVGIQLRLEDRVARTALLQSEASSRAELSIGMSEHAESIAKANNGEQLSEAEEIALDYLVDTWFRRAISGRGSSQQIRGGDGSTARALFSVMLHNNTGLRLIWEGQRKREATKILHLTPDAAFIDEFADEIRADLERLDELPEQ